MLYELSDIQSILFWCKIWSGPDCMKWSSSCMKMRVRFRRFGDVSCLHQQMLDLVTNYSPWGETQEVSKTLNSKSVVTRQVIREDFVAFWMRLRQSSRKQLLAAYVCPSVRLYQVESSWTDFREVFCWGFFTKICDLAQFLLKFDRNNTLHENLKYVKFTISCWTLWGPKQEFREKL